MPAIKGAKVRKKRRRLSLCCCVLFLLPQKSFYLQSQVFFVPDFNTRVTNQPLCCANRNDYQQCLYPECLTSPEEKLDSRSNWSKISCGSEQRVSFQLASFLFP